ncbi:putative histidine kinase group protein [Rosellinia necatrix]|uniref:Putative histidine kinase group protein n=1 Tax=Rosellinia necatrix TaxID=77044 RepID=A0A1S7UIF9_ROSNE|nr:putative histidine kinase group protein [Rosellinia necatrix]
MAKKNKKPAGGESVVDTCQTAPAAPSTTKDNGINNKAASSSSSLASSALVICRNKHWRYISSFHGPWLQLPVEVLETLANANYYMPLPRPVDPAVFYDLVKIRQLVDGATDLAVRAANGVASSALSGSLAGGTAHHMQALGLGFGNAGGAKLSPERRFRMREQATQKLSRAYHLDEIASSVATMQSTSTLENVAGLVLQRSPHDPDANYVHFFHEKIPSRQLAECTDLRALDMIIGQRPSDCEPLRTRAIVRMFKEDFEGAAQDLTTALSVCRLNRPHKSPMEESMQLERRTGRRRDNPPLDEKDQPSSTEVQLLFQRAGCYLTLACDHVEFALARDLRIPVGALFHGTSGVDNINGNKSTEGENPPIAQFDDQGPIRRQLESRKIVRLYAKRALRDYMEYLKHFHYSSNLPIEVSDDFSRQVNQATHRTKRYHGQPRWASQDPNSPTGNSIGHTVYPLAALFSATPPADLPPYPSVDIVHATFAANSASAIETTTEAVTYHPLLTDALHSLLLCHTLVQTSTKELQRHAYMVARLARLADGYPVFQASRSPARADWIEVLRRAENWIELGSSWEVLCAPAPLPMPLSPSSLSAATTGVDALSITGPTSPTETDEQRKERMRHQAIIEALEDERVNDEASFKAAILARQKRAEADQAPTSNGTSAHANSAPKRWAVDDGREYPILTERAEAVARWIREAPAVSGTGNGKRKKKPGAKKASSIEKLGTTSGQPEPIRA